MTVYFLSFTFFFDLLNLLDNSFIKIRHISNANKENGIAVAFHCSIETYNLLTETAMAVSIIACKNFIVKSQSRNPEDRVVSELFAGTLSRLFSRQFSKPFILHIPQEAWNGEMDPLE